MPTMMETFEKQLLSATVCTKRQKTLAYLVNVPLDPQDDHKLRSRQTPPLGEAAGIRVSVDRTHSNLKGVKRVKGELLHSSKALEDMATKLDNIRLAQQTYIAPISRLPAKMLVLIFKYACEDYGLNIMSCTPIRIASACILRRDIVHQNSSKWTSMRLPRPMCAHRCMGDTMKADLRRILRATRGLPLSQPIVHTPEYRDHTVLAMLLEHSDQWQHLIVSIFTCNLRFLLLLDPSFAVLHTVEIDVTWPSVKDATEGDMDARCIMPALRTLKFEGRARNVANVPDWLPWRNITELQTISNTSFALMVSRLCVRLVRWALYGIGINEMGQPLGGDQRRPGAQRPRGFLDTRAIADHHTVMRPKNISAPALPR